ncbi:MAG: hypothetical protein AAF125_02765 [Chloroflexota bacterium]
MRNLLHTTEIGNGTVTQGRGVHYLRVYDADATAYHDAQLTDYTLPARNFVHGPGTGSVALTAQFDRSNPQGTAGFGLWNHPFSPEMRGLPRPPQAAWFFYGSPPNDMPLARGVPGYGWKATTISALRAPFWGLLPFAPLGFVLNRIPVMFDLVWPLAQDAIACRETRLDPAIMTHETRYEIGWERDAVTFTVDGRTVLESHFRLGGAMGFIAWIDNQYAVVTPQGRFGWGLVEVPAAQGLAVWDLDLG